MRCRRGRLSYGRKACSAITAVRSSHLVCSGEIVVGHPACASRVTHGAAAGNALSGIKCGVVASFLFFQDKYACV